SACRCLLSNTANNIQTTTKRTNTPHVNEHAYIEQHLLTLSNFLGTPQAPHSITKPQQTTLYPPHLADP
ncbi:MAG: hypothetical protein IJ047_03210, partial [Paludibacteraceae bacterium]|nr:hypothetical protein [Paludibacteraceae bacterium]